MTAVEAMAKALFDIEAGNMTNWMMGATTREKYQHRAATLVTALTAAGWAVVPREPTEVMIEAGQVEVNILDDPNPPNAFEFLSRDEVRDIWTAMIEAAK